MHIPQEYRQCDVHLHIGQHHEDRGQQIDHKYRRSSFVTSGSAAIVGASVVYALADSVPMMLGAPVLTWLAGITGVLLVIYGLKK